MIKKTIYRVTKKTLSDHHGIDRDRELVVGLVAEDLIEIRPKGTHRPKTISIFDVYDHIIRCESNRAHLEKARTAKERKSARLAALRQSRAEKRLVWKP